MSEPMIRRRSLPDSLRYLAQKLDGPLTDGERAGIALTLNSLADEADAFAHELAEQQRASGRDDYCWGTDCCGQHGGVADLIDPPAHDAGPVRPDEEPTT